MSLEELLKETRARVDTMTPSELRQTATDVLRLAGSVVATNETLRAIIASAAADIRAGRIRAARDLLAAMTDIPSPVVQPAALSIVPKSPPEG